MSTQQVTFDPSQRPERTISSSTEQINLKGGYSMSALVHLPQLQIQPDQPPIPLINMGNSANIQALSGQRQQQQALMPGALKKQQQDLEAGLLDNQIKQRQVKQGQALDAAYQGALTPDPVTGRPTFDQGKVLNAITASGNGSLVPQLTETFNTLDQKKAALLDMKQKTASAAQDYAGSLAAEVKTAGYTPGAAGIALAHLSEVDPTPPTNLNNSFNRILTQLNSGSIRQLPGVQNSEKLPRRKWLRKHVRRKPKSSPMKPERKPIRNTKTS